MAGDPEYRAELRQRMIAGTTGPMEPLFWYYSTGRPVERVEHGARGAFTDFTRADRRRNWQRR